MATDITLFIGEPPYATKFKFSDQVIWDGVRSQIEVAMTTGRGTITVPNTNGGRTVHVYNDSLRISWVDNGS
ncbi:MAG: hypothetical protein ACRDT9_00700 [Agromyces sp.]